MPAPRHYDSPPIVSYFITVEYKNTINLLPVNLSIEPDENANCKVMCKALIKPENAFTLKVSRYFPTLYLTLSVCTKHGFDSRICKVR